MTAKRPGLLNRYFYFFMSLLIAVTVIYGFGHTINDNLLHAVVPRPWLLSLHACIFSGWVLFLILQSALVRTHHVGLHRTLGWFGAALGASMPIVGIATAIAMARFKIQQLHAPVQATEDFIIVPLWDISCFTVAFTLAILWRRKPEFHRRLILVATCALMAAAFGRFPLQILPGNTFYAGVDALIVLGVVRDLVVDRRIHKVYVYALPIFIVGQIVVVQIMTRQPAFWTRIAYAIVG